METIKKIILSHKILYEIYFLLSGKKINKKRLNRKINKLQKKSIKNKKTIDKLIISLTSYGERINDLKYTLYSLLAQTIHPEKIIVWLAYKEIVPEELNVFKQLGVEFQFCEDTKSYKKLIPALKNYQNYCIVTTDDDIYYKRNWLKKIWKFHLRYPNIKITHTAHIVGFYNNDSMQPYKKWKHNINKTFPGKNIFPTGCGGILYPPCEIQDLFLNSDIFMNICPNADDIWFYFMGIFSGQKTMVVSHPHNHLKYVDIYKEYGLNGNSSLQILNVNHNQNDTQFLNVLNFFNLSVKDFYELIK